MFESYLKPPVSFPTLTGSIVTFNSQYAGLPLKSHVVDVDYTGSAISGVHIQNTCGINQWDEVWEQGSINDSTGEPSTSSYYSRSKYFIKVIPNTSYYFYSKTSAQVVMYEYDYNHNYIGLKVVTNSVQTTRNNTYYIRIRISGGDYTQGNVSINYPSTDTSYHAFVGQSFNITFSIPIYGGSYDCLTGIVTSNKDSGGGDVSPTYQQTATANCETSLGVNNIFADTGNTTLQYPKFG